MMKSLRLLVWVSLCLGMSMKTEAAGFLSISDAVSALWQNQAAIRIADLRLEMGSRDAVKQSAYDQGKFLHRITKNEQEINFYLSESAVELRSFAASQNQLIGETAFESNGILWDLIQSKKETRDSLVYVTAFGTTLKGKNYYGYVAGDTLSQTMKGATDFLRSLSVNQTRSLTSPDYKGKKYYLGFGAAMSSDPSMMQNEVKYDVLHTHDIFTKDIGGNYIGVKYTSYKDATQSNVKKTWADIKGKITADDMYMQYSSGHGSQSGLAIGLTYDQIRDQALSFGAKETVIFIMACHSGGLVASFDKKKADWKDYQSQGKTLFVMASSKHSETSSTGPGKDPQEPNGASGSAGSAFGHSLWKALIGHADGEVDGVKDGYLSLGEIQKFTVKKTIEIGDHTPVYTGAYDGKLLMNRVPPREFLDSLEGTSEGLTETEVIERIQSLDAEMRL